MEIENSVLCVGVVLLFLLVVLSLILISIPTDNRILSSFDNLTWDLGSVGNAFVDFATGRGGVQRLRQD